MLMQLLIAVLPIFRSFIVANLKIIKNKGVPFEYTLEKGNKMSKSKYDYNFKIIDLLYNYEEEHNIPNEERVTEWHNDLDIAIPKYISGKGYISMKEIYKKYKEVRKENKVEQHNDLS